MTESTCVRRKPREQEPKSPLPTSPPFNAPPSPASSSLLFQDVATGALQLLFRNFSQREEMTTTFKQVQLLVSETDVSIYRHTRKDLDRLRMIVEKSELWVDRIDDVSGASLSLAAKQNFAEILR